jgi:hypothetical protein
MAILPSKTCRSWSKRRSASEGEGTNVRSTSAPDRRSTTACPIFDRIEITPCGCRLLHRATPLSLHLPARMPSPSEFACARRPIPSPCPKSRRASERAYRAIDFNALLNLFHDVLLVISQRERGVDSPVQLRRTRISPAAFEYACHSGSGRASKVRKGIGSFHATRFRAQLRFIVAPLL